MKTTQEKICSLSKKISAFLAIGFCFLMVALGAGVIGLLVLMVTSPETKESFLQAFITVDGKAQSIPLEQIFAILLALIAYAAIFGVMLLVLRNVFQDLSQNGQPFEKKHTVSIKRVAVLTVALAVVGSMMDGIGSFITLGRPSFHLDFTGILFGVLIYCIAYIYDYGCDLQQQSNETL